MTAPAGSFAARFAAATAERGRLAVGIDPHPGLLADWGLADDVAGLRAFALAAAEAFAPVAGLVKPQVAFFERHGAAGLAVLEETIAALRAGGALVIADAKRGDIGSTMAGYADAWLRPSSPLASDALTVSPYLGFGAVEPAVTAAAAAGAAVFVLARTSNPEAVGVQSARTAAGIGVAQSIVDAAAARNADGAGTIGVVVGATGGLDLDLSALRGPILAPGLGAQGARPADLPEVFAGADLAWLVPAASRSVLVAGPSVDALRAAAVTLRDEVEAALGAST